MTPTEKRLLCDAIPLKVEGRPTDRRGRPLMRYPEQTLARWVDEESDDSTVLSIAAKHCERGELRAGANRADVATVLVAEARKALRVDELQGKDRTDAEAEIAEIEERMRGVARVNGAAREGARATP